MDPLIRKLRPLLLAWLHRSRSGSIPFVRRFSYKDIKKATDGFHTVIYSNSHGAAYKARFRGGEVALVKEVRDCDQEKHVFYREVQLLGRLHHRHLLALKGFSLGRKRLLVFDSIEYGSLKEHLNDPLKTPLNWKTRLRIAIGVAAALVSHSQVYNSMHACTAYLHQSWKCVIPSAELSLLFTRGTTINLQTLVHIGEQNICFFLAIHSRIMSPSAQLSDVGILSSNGDFVTMQAASRSKDSMEQSCGGLIFQLGVLILELITGQASETGSTDVVQWIQESRFGNSIPKMIDPDLGNNYDSRELKVLLAVARLCVKSGDKPNFSIEQIFKYLQRNIDTALD
ncbi:hypothetical protein Tsubulata_016020 [Turnera subulata]|uniref:Tyrosine-protein kinase catalytic domain-containing protein n=1 Tax=Turnera subulata TaxID=218843 RepID=A0A9Q0J3Z4_9ROSI|nr:hypothetical protein Tsubulata_016020 [Turnera subulata]